MLRGAGSVLEGSAGPGWALGMCSNVGPKPCTLHPACAQRSSVCWLKHLRHLLSREWVSAAICQQQEETVVLHVQRWERTQPAQTQQPQASMGTSTPPACVRPEMVLSGGIEKKKAFLIKKKVSNSCGYKRGK